MARLPNIKRFSLEDFQDQRSWIFKLFEPLNQFLTTVSQGLNNQLTQSDNMNAMIQSIQVQTNKTLTAGSGTLPSYATLFAPISFNSTLKTAPQGVVVFKCVDSASNASLVPYGVSPVWAFAGGVITISHISGLDVSKTYNVLLWVCGG